VTEDSFGSRLRRERERRQIALSSLSANTKIGVALFEGLERDDLSRWPPGIFRRAFIRAYAEGIGVDADALTREFLERYPDPLDPPAAAAAANGVPRRAEQPYDLVTPAALADPALRLTLADSGGWFVGGPALVHFRDRWAAVACDAGVVVAIAVSVFVALGTFWLPLAVATLGYYLGGILLLGNTPGVCLCAPGSSRIRTRAMASVRSTAGKQLVQLIARALRRKDDKHQSLERTTA
jgi:transcriptional regulator with XRE-family HTH domain